MKIKDFIHANFDINCDYKIYRGVWNDDGTLLWQTRAQAYPGKGFPWLEEDIKYITIDVKSKELVIEI